MANTSKGRERGREIQVIIISYYQEYYLLLILLMCIVHIKRSKFQYSFTNIHDPLSTLPPSLPPSLFSLLADAVQIKLLVSDEPQDQAEHNNTALYSEESNTSNENNTMYMYIHCNLSVSSIVLSFPPSVSPSCDFFCLKI